MNKRLIIGRFGKAYGVKGWIKVHSFTEPRNKILDYSPWYIKEKDIWQELPIEETKIHGTSIIAKIPDVNTPEIAKTYTNFEIATNSNQLPKLAEDEYYWYELEGLTVINQNKDLLGKIDHLIATGSNDVIVVKKEQQEILIPYIDDVIKTVDLTKKTMTVEWDI